MPEAVYQVMTLLSALVAPLPIGTNLGVLHLLWMLVSGQLLSSRGAVIPGLSGAGLTDAHVRRAWAALGQGAWTSDDLVAGWGEQSSRPGRGSRTATAATARWPSMSPASGGRGCRAARPSTTTPRPARPCRPSPSALSRGWAVSPASG